MSFPGEYLYPHWLAPQVPKCYDGTEVLASQEMVNIVSGGLGTAFKDIQINPSNIAVKDLQET